MRTPLLAILICVFLLMAAIWAQGLEFLAINIPKPAPSRPQLPPARSVSDGNGPKAGEAALVSPFRPRIVSNLKPAPWEAVRLVGIVRHETGVLVMLRDDTSGEVRRLQVGEVLEGWRVQQADNGCAVLKRGHASRRLCVGG